MEKIDEMMKSDEVEKENKTPPVLGGVADMGSGGWRWGW